MIKEKVWDKVENYRIEGYTQEKIAEIMGINVRSIRRRYKDTWKSEPIKNEENPILRLIDDIERYDKIQVPLNNRKKERILDI